MRTIKQYEDGAVHYTDDEHGFIVQMNGRVSWSDSWEWVTDPGNPLFEHRFCRKLRREMDYYYKNH